MHWFLIIALKTRINLKVCNFSWKLLSFIENIQNPQLKGKGRRAAKHFCIKIKVALKIVSEILAGC